MPICIVLGKREVSYTCEIGYEMVGNPKVRCGPNGRWMEEFPNCQKTTSLCPLDYCGRQSKNVKTSYERMVKTGKKIDTAAIGTMRFHSCPTTSSSLYKWALLGPRVSVCMANGKWSGQQSEVKCIEFSTLPAQQDNSGS